MEIPTVLKGGKRKNVSKDELQYLLVTNKALKFKRVDGWVIVDGGKMRKADEPFSGRDRREHQVFATGY